MKKTLIISNSNDAHADVIMGRMQERSVPVVRINTDELVTGDYCWRIYADLCKSGYQTWIPDEVQTVWFRKIVLPEPTDYIQSFIKQELEGFLEALMALHQSARWINHPQCIENARAKIAQLQKAKSFGFRVPDSLVTTSLNALKEFAKEHHGCIVAKPIRSQVIGVGDEARVVGTRTLSPEHFNSAISATPCYVQEKLLIQHEIRVVCFGGKLFSFKLTARKKADDLKQLALDEIHHEPYSLDETTSRKVQQLLRMYGLEFGAIDFAVIDSGEPVFLELNPNGQWMWLQYMTGINLEDPFIDFVLNN